ncbi:MAG: cell division protein ZapE, partial [Burkholderia sp.]|nr:cell division protein ZapE [Burkholderia sp.]
MLDEALIEHSLAARGIVADARQREAIAALAELLRPAARDFHSRYQGVYCHGLPGRGKSLVVDTVF